MSHCSTIVNQVLKIFSRHEFEPLAQEHHNGQKLRKFNRWSQFLAMTIAQLASRKSLRDLVENLTAQKNKLYHLGMKKTARTTLARVNEEQPASLYEAMFHKLLERCHKCAPKGKSFDFKLKQKLYLLDATTIDLCLSLFSWAEYRKTKGAIKVYVGLDTDGYLPEFVSVTDGKGHEINWAKTLKFPKGSFVVFDRGFNDYKWFEALDTAGLFFVTRLKDNARVSFLTRRRGPKSEGIIDDRKIKFDDIKDLCVWLFITTKRRIKSTVSLPMPIDCLQRRYAPSIKSAGRLSYFSNG